MPKKLVILAVMISVLLPALPARADGPITLGMGILTSIAMSPDGSRLAVGTSTGVYFYDPVSFVPLGFWNTGNEVNYIRWSPRSDILALVEGPRDYYPNDVYFWSVTGGQPVWKTAVCDECAVVFSSDGATVSVADDNTSRNVFDALTGASQGVVQGYLGPRLDWYTALSPNQQWSAWTWFYGDIFLKLAAGSNSRNFSLPDDHGQLYTTSVSMTWSSDSRELFTILDNEVYVWDVATASILRTLSGFSGRVKHSMWAPEGGHVISVEGDQLVVADVTSRLPVLASTHQSELVTIQACQHLAFA